MSETTSDETALDDALDRMSDLLEDGTGDGDDDADDATADTLRQEVERVREASLTELLGAAGFDTDEVGPTDVPRLLAGGDTGRVETLRKLLDVSELSASESDDELVDGLDEVLGPTSSSGDDATDEESESTEKNGDDGSITVSDLFSGAASLAKGWSDTRRSASEDHAATEGNGDGDADETGDADDADDDLLDVDELKSHFSFDDDEDAAEAQGGSRGNPGSRGKRYSTVPKKRSDMGRSGRFSSMKSRK